MAASPGFNRAGAIEGGQCGRVIAQHRQAAGEVDLGGGLLGQELGGALQRLTRLGEAAELQSCLAQKMKRLPGVGPRFGDLRQQRLGPGEVAGGRALHGIARECLDLEVGEGHPPRLAQLPMGWNRFGSESAGDAAAKLQKVRPARMVFVPRSASGWR